MTAGLATLRCLRDEDPYPELEERGAQWVAGMREAAAAAGVEAVVDHCGSMVGLFFSAGPVANYADVQRADTGLFQRYFRGMLEEGIYIAPSAFEVGFISTTHSSDLVDETVAAAGRVLSRL